ncbi:hypothetical protein [Dipodfec virus UOA04_Rod_535]|nr:hypothetical protein [Dipodfec virus UOA04_Rod_535]
MNKQLLIAQRNNKVVYEPDNTSDMSVKQGLSMSPSDVAKMTARGLGVSSQINQELFYDGDDSPSFYIPLERRRGVDVAEIWEAEQTAKKKLYQAHVKDVSMYGE